MFPSVGVGQIRLSHTPDLVLCNGKLTVPRSTLIWVPHHSMHNAAHNGDEPERFRPGARLPSWAKSGCVREQCQEPVIWRSHDLMSSTLACGPAGLC